MIMSKDWVQDIAIMHDKYGVNQWVKRKVAEGDLDPLHEYLNFRIKFLVEELTETQSAFANKDSEEIVDGLIDLCVVAIGTLDAFGINPYVAWDRVAEANMAKTVGVKASRPNPLGLPDLIKPEGWTAPSHEDNHGILPSVCNIL
jgi:predicted HAD superfamily Cof-like phosphohydrolase